MTQSIKLSDAIVEYVNYMRLERGQTPGTVVQRGIRLRHFGKWLAEEQNMFDPLVKQIQLSHIRQFIGYLVDERSICATTVRGYLESLRAMYGYLLEYNYVEDSPVHRIRMPKRNAPNRELVSNEELVRFFEATELIQPARRAIQARAILSAYVYAGLRSAEVRGIKVDDVSFNEDGCFVAVRHGKGDKRRVVPVHREAVPHFRAWLEERGTVLHNYLFLVDKRRRLGLSALIHLFDEIKFLARVDRPGLKPHALRHNYATRKLRDGVNLYHISQLLGHANIQTTINYLHGDLAQLTEVAQKGGLFG
ncbi:MAG: tyrosine-type recombinase/integrase [Armatimonadetes bacterium]|nr:tyrosine-type recombinase/integrase [Armatimonadota bacterium]